MPKANMRHMIILLPGISGSVLQKDGKDVWAISSEGAWIALTTMLDSLQQLRLDGDDPDTDDLGDGVQATRLIRDAHIVPGLHKIDGYSALPRLIADHFNVVNGSDKQPANYFEFAYDWRRDNRVAAHQLQTLVEKQLPRWCEYTHDPNARVILLAHSMGGLVARYYTEVLGGWRHCLALITFGTPYRGSVNALDVLTKPYKKLFVDLTDVMQSFTSVYQLLPIYEMVEIAGKYRRVAEIEDLPGLSQSASMKAVQALKFHREIEGAVEVNRQDPTYLATYKTIPIVGVRQPTLQSAIVSNNTLVTCRDAPTWINNALRDGDGTVPRVSATPIELSGDYRDTFLIERHSSLHSNPRMLDDVLERLRDMQAPHTRPIRGPEIRPALAELPAISLDVDDLYLANEPVVLRARVTYPYTHSGVLEACISPVKAGILAATYPFEVSGDGWVLNLRALPSGLYRVTVQLRERGPKDAAPVHDIFQVA